MNVRGQNTGGWRWFLANVRPVWTGQWIPSAGSGTGHGSSGVEIAGGVGATGGVVSREDRLGTIGIGANREAAMNKRPTDITRDLVNALWKAAQALRGQPAPDPTARVKLNGRRGYGDSDIPLPDKDLGDR
jgi:hypothetical protein